jgi:hypothetical protein
MGTRFRTMLAPIGVPTGDGRRFQAGGITLAEAPFPFEWVRQREGGHNGAVSVGAVQETAVLTVKDALAGDWISAEAAEGLDAKLEGVFARGELFDGVDREEMPRLAEDVAEALHLIGSGTLGPSVDLDSFEAVPVMEGSDEPITWDDIEDYMEEHDGEEPNIELLVTAGRVRAATLVSIPAFLETSRPLELIVDETEDGSGSAAADTEALAALVASVSAPHDTRPPVAAFALPALDGPTAITWDWESGRVFGHIATWQTCHVGYSDVCVTAPRGQGDAPYAWFNRYGVDTADGGTIAAGRLTLGGEHAGLALAASPAMAAYDPKTVAADVVAYEDEHGIVVAGAIRPGLSGADRAVLERRKVSGDWREIGGALALVEVLALSPGPRASSEPGFPVATHSRGGRQVALTAALGPEPGAGLHTSVPAVPVVDVDALAAALERRQDLRNARLVARQNLTTALATGTANRRAALADVLQGS